MYISQLSLTNYRNYSRLSTELPPGPILLQGDNAQGKTSLLEAIYFLSTTRSVHARADQQLINWLVLRQEPLPFARVEATVKTKLDSFQLAVTLVREADGFRKDIRLNGAKKRALDIIGKLKTVMFLPEDIELVTGAPAIRRRYLDTTLCQINPEYCNALSRYNKVLTQRNALLKNLAERSGSPDQLLYWDEQLAQDGATLVTQRHNAVLELDAVARQRHREVSGGKEGLRLYYTPSFDLYKRPKPDYQLPLIMEDLAPYSTVAPPVKEVRQTFLAYLQQTRREDIQRGVTLVGPHRDDLHFLVDGIDMTLYGSRGQQRTAALSTKLAEVALMQQSTGEMPVLLLDDVMSELDAERRQQIITIVDQAGQALLTTTDWADYDPDFRRRAKLFSVMMGRLEEAAEEVGHP
ncbi:MAG TPA: DNA replication/repair protein RecF [Anaerolineae bacterium]|nr:DNA replication/repair protein RecF [Anaerolineae bacterium]HXW00739.1 DNA replication/repair protein RecF [Anaerolineae bacterium]